MRLVFSKDASGQGDIECDLLIYLSEGGLSAHFRSLALDPVDGEESYHFEVAWRGECNSASNSVAEMMAELAAADCGDWPWPLVRSEDLPEIQESLIQAISDGRRLVQQTMNLGLVSGMAA